MPRHDLRPLREKIRRLREAGEERLAQPWPTFDRLPGDPAYVENDRGSSWAWSPYTPQALL